MPSPMDSTVIGWSDKHEATLTVVSSLHGIYVNRVQHVISLWVSVKIWTVLGLLIGQFWRLPELTDRWQREWRAVAHFDLSNRWKDYIEILHGSVSRIQIHRNLTILAFHFEICNYKNFAFIHVGSMHTQPTLMRRWRLWGPWDNNFYTCFQ